MALPSDSPLKIDIILERLENVQNSQRLMSGEIYNLNCNFQNFQVSYTKEHEKLASDMKETLRRLDKVDMSIDKFEETQQVVVLHTEQIKVSEENIHTLQKDLETLETSLKNLADSVKPLIFVNRVFVWISIVLGASVIALLWGILTHTITIAKP